jgi:succinoglycan biosynthesis protein ExoO
MSDIDPHHQRGAPETSAPHAEEPLISVLMANLNGQAYLRQAIRSVLRQTHARLELIISDDGSEDDSCRIIREEMAGDARLILLENDAPSGPGAARNRALTTARGEWIAIIDSDDIIHPERLARLLRAALHLQADMVADDIIFFGDDPLERNKTLLQDARLDAPARVDAVTLVSGDLGGAEGISLGYLKPLIRRAQLGELRFDERLLIDEDHDLYLRLVLAGARFMLIPDAMYLYRRHSASASYRQSVAKLGQMIAAQERLLLMVAGQPDLARAVAHRLAQTRAQLEYGRIVEAIRAGAMAKALRLLARRPECLRFLTQSLRERGRRRLRRPRAGRQRLNLVLGSGGQARQAAYPDARIVPVPDVPDSGWQPSAAGTWAYLAHLSCEYDLDILALDRAGAFALGLVPRWHSARIEASAQAATGGQARPVMTAEGL